MARKLFMMMALITLVLLAQAVPGLAVTYTLEAGDYSWVETHGNASNGLPYPGSPYSTLHGTFSSADGTTWRIGDQYYKYLVPTDPPILTEANLMNSAKATVTVEDSVNEVIKFQTVYDSIESPGTVKFSVHIPGVTDISSIDAKITMTQTFKFNTNGQWTWQEGTIAGTGTDASTGLSFTLSGILYQNDGDHTHNGGITNFTLNYPTAAPTPIPGAVWLLGTGLLGLACVGWRRRS